MKESRKLNNIYKIRVDNIELDINNNRNNNTTSYETNDSNCHFIKNTNNANKYDFINSTKFYQSNLNKSTKNNISSSCNCSCTCCCCTKDKNVAQVILSLINKSTKCPKCNSEFYDLSTSFLNKSSNKIYKYKNENCNDNLNTTKISKSNHSYLEKINLIKNNTNIKTSSPLSHTYNNQDLSQKQNKILTSKLDYSQYIKSPLISNIKSYKPSNSLSASKNVNNLIETNLMKSKNNREPVQVLYPNKKIDGIKNYIKSNRLFTTDNNHVTPKIINESKNYGTNFFLNVYNINETTQTSEHNNSESNDTNERKSSARNLKMKYSNDNNVSQNHNRSSRNNSILNDSNVSSKPPPPVKTRNKDLLNQTKLNDSVNNTINNINKLFMGNASSLRANLNDNNSNNTMTNLTNCVDINNNNNNISRRSTASINNQTDVTIQNDDDDDKVVMDSNIDFTKTMSSNDFSNYIDKIINQFRTKSKLYNNVNKEKDKSFKSNESMNNLYKLRTNEINKPLVPKIENYDNLNEKNNFNNSFVSNIRSKQQIKTSEINNSSKLTKDSNCLSNQQQASKFQLINKSQKTLNNSENSKIKNRSDINNNKQILIPERRYDFIEGSSFINFTHSYEIEEDDDDDLDRSEEELAGEDEYESTTTQNEKTINNSSQS